jgi:hypothetical protein
MKGSLYGGIINILSLKIGKFKPLWNFRMKNKWKSKNIKPATVDGKITLKWI